MKTRKIAIIGGGPSGLFVLKRLVDTDQNNVEIEVFEKKAQFGSGMPYSSDGASREHITNVSGNELPDLQPTLSEWLETIDKERLKYFNINLDSFNEYKVLPRLLLGEYLEHHFRLLETKAKQKGILLIVHRSTLITDVIDDPLNKIVEVKTSKHNYQSFDQVVICTGHNFPVKYEGKIKGYYDSPYPPSKLNFEIDHPVAIRGSSLTAVDAVRTLARKHGTFTSDKGNNITYKLSDSSSQFKMVLHTRNGLLPAIRFHLEDTSLGKEGAITQSEIEENRKHNANFLSLDFVFEKYFKQPIKTKSPDFFEKIKDMQMEEFVGYIMNMRESIKPFDLFKGEYAEAEKSIRKKESVYWKEMLAVLSFTMNYPAKYFSAEDTIRLHRTLLPLISIVIAFMPQGSARELLALHNAGILELIAVGDDSTVEPLTQGGIVYHFVNENNMRQSIKYKTYIDAVGQPHLNVLDVPYKSLIEKKTISRAKIKFKEISSANLEKERGNKDVVIDGDVAYLNVSGIAINDSFQVVDEYGSSNERIYMMAVPYMGGYNPDYSGLDFCEAASKLIVKSIFKE